MNAPSLKPLDATSRARGSEAGRGVSEAKRGAGSRAAPLTERALAACLDYEHWASEVARLTAAIHETRCPNESEGDPELFMPREPSCFHEASTDIPSGYDRSGEFVSGPRPSLGNVAAAVADCPECSRLVVLIRSRRHARRQLGAAKRAVRRAAREALREVGR